MRILKWVGIALGVLIGIILLSGLGLYAKARLQSSKNYAMPEDSLAVSLGDGSVARGEHLGTVICMECHGDDLGGNPAFLDDPVIGTFVTPNLTDSGEMRAWTNDQFVTAMRTGVTPSGAELRDRWMPRRYKGQMTDEELKANWAYLKSLPALPTSTDSASG